MRIRPDERQEDTGHNTRRALLRAAPALAAMLVLAILALLVLPNAATPTLDPERAWPRPYDPAKPFNMNGVPGVTDTQRERAENLLLRSLQTSPKWADINDALDAGWFSLGDEDIGFLHLINPALIFDGKLFDPEYPESLVYKVEGDKRIFAAYMFIADPDMPRDDPRLVGFAGRLMDWHNHENLCLLAVPWTPIGRAAGLVNEAGGCDFPGARPALSRHPLDPLAGDPDAPPSSVASYAMTHVWVIAHECGPFSAVEGPAEGVTLVARDVRSDVCDH